MDVIDIAWGILILVLALLAYVVVRGFRARGRMKRIRQGVNERDTGM